MWPFGKSTKQKGFDAAALAIQMSQAALQVYMRNGRLVAAMLGDNYVLGYVTKRLLLATQMACRAVKLDERYAVRLYEDLVMPQFFDWNDLAAIARRTASLTSARDSGVLFGKGCDDATRLFNYWIGAKDIETHPKYDDALKIARATAMSEAEASAPESLVHGLEAATFGTYFHEKHGNPLA